MNAGKDTVNILGVEITRKSREDVRSLLSRALEKREYLKLFTPNAEILYRASREPELAALLNKGDLLLPDGIGVIIASRLARKPIRERITGIDTAEFILSVAAERGLSVYLLGGAEGVASKAAERLREKLPSLNICGSHHGYFNKTGKEAEAVIAHIAAARPDILFVCLGFPEQERFILENTSSLPFLRLSAGLGGSLDVWSGEVIRAPRIMQKTGLEWLFRTLCAPNRIRRAPHLFGFAFKALKYTTFFNTNHYNSPPNVSK